MNGRIYDPTLGRFLQADPFIQAPKNSQSYNRYAYVLNNPLSYTDPSGYNFIKKYWRVIVAAVVTYVTAGAAGGWAASWGFGAVGTMGNAIAAGAMTGFIGGAVATGSLKGALTGAFTGAVFGAIGGQIHGAEGTSSAWSTGEQMFAHASAGGVLSVVQGGKFGHGFITAGIMKGIGKIQTSASLARATIQAIAGGTISKITGGKFANGAVTAAIQFVVNETADDRWNFESIDDKELFIATEVKGEIAVKGEHVKLAGVSYDGKDVKLEGPSVSGAGFGVSGSGIQQATSGPLSLSVDQTGTISAGAEACTHGGNGLCGSVSVKGTSPKLQAIRHNVHVATTPQLNTYTGKSSSFLHKLFGKPDVGY